MRASLIVGLVALSISFGQPVAGQKGKPQKQQEASKPSPAPTAVPPVVTPQPSQPESKLENQRPQKEPEKSYWKRAFAPETLSNWALAIVGFVGIGVALGTLRAIRRQAEIMLRQTEATEIAANAARDTVEAARDNALAAKAGAEAAKANAEAAKENAIAARDSVEMVINKERARIAIKLKDLKLPTTRSLAPIYKPNLIRVGYDVISYGPTPAFIMEASGTFSSTHSADPVDPMPTHPMRLEKIMPANSTIETGTYCWDEGVELTPETTTKIHQLEIFLHFSGTIQFRDVFGRDHETRFRYFWKVSPNLTMPDGTPFCNWAKNGPQGENSET